MKNVIIKLIVFSMINCIKFLELERVQLKVLKKFWEMMILSEIQM